jgi:hypothetical protein
MNKYRLGIFTIILLLTALVATPALSATSSSQILSPVGSTTQQGATSGSLSSMGLLDQANSDDNPSAYLSFLTPSTVYIGYTTYQLPVDINPARISSILLQINFKGADASTQLWTWSIFNWKTQMWIPIGDTIGTQPDVWNIIAVRIRNFSPYISAGREIRLQVISSNDTADAKIDYQAFHVTYAPTIPTVTPSSTPLVSLTKGALVFPATYTPLPSPTPGPAPTIGGCSIFPANNVWNTRVDSLPVHSLSSQWINSIGSNDAFHMDFGSGTWNGGPIGIPYNTVTGSSVTKYNVTFSYSDESDEGPYPIPASPNMEYGSDHHILVVDTQTCTLYETYNMSFGGGQWSGGSGAIWSLNSNTLRPNTWTSADAAGLPILPGLVRYEEVAAGHINHAIRFTANSTNSFIWPARHLTSGTQGVLTATPPMGARFRLKASYDISGFSPEMQVILRAMKEYGIILADNGSDWYISGSPNGSWDNDMLHTLDVLKGSNFEAVDESSLMVDPNSAAVTMPTRWQPSVGSTWQWDLGTPVDTSYPAQVYDIDLFDNDASVVAALHSQGKKVICYMSVGSWENWRPDAAQFPVSVIGNDYAGWPGEKFLDIRKINTLAPILRARLDQCKQKGFDGIEPDNIENFNENTGFPISYEDQLNFNRWIATEAHARGLSIGLKNDADQVTDLLSSFDWALTEDCFYYGWCSEMSPFITAGKPVFAAEYTDTGITLNQFCPQAATLQFSPIFKNRDLGSWRQTCP